jgi:aryl-alcohol dehydrogenase-like predicted oxidoreductase
MSERKANRPFGEVVSNPFHRPPRRRFGRSGMDVSILGFGGAVVGLKNYIRASDPADASTEERAVASLRTAVEAGINYFDTAPGYGGGRSEEVMGRTLESHRDDIYLATKVGVHPGGSSKDWSESLGSSLERLRTDHVDVLQFHGETWTDEEARWALGEPTQWLEEVKAKGLALNIGVTAEAPSGGLETMLRTLKFDMLQIAYSVIYQDACDYQRAPFGIIPLAKSLDLGVTTMRTTTSGVFQRLLHSEFPELDSARLSRLAIKFVLSTPEVDCALVGMSEPHEVEQNAVLAADEQDRLDLVKLHDFYGGWTDARLARAS